MIHPPPLPVTYCHPLPLLATNPSSSAQSFCPLPPLRPSLQDSVNRLLLAASVHYSFLLLMSYRGRGRGRGYGGGGGFRFVKQVPFELFPEISDFPDATNVEEDMVLSYWSRKFPAFWNSSPYKLENVSEAAKKKESTQLKRFSDKDSDRTKRKAPLSDYIKMTDDYVPAELGEKKERHKQKKVRWNPDSDLQKLDLFEKREQHIKLQDEKGEKEKKEGEEEEEDDENIEEEDEEMSDDDYYQNIDFDDDEDDFNMPDDNDDEPTL